MNRFSIKAIVMEPWDVQPDDSRSADKLETFIIFCEDNVCEPSYFRAFQSEIKGIKINIIDNQGSGQFNLNNTIRHCIEKDLIVFDKGQYSIKEDVTENIWCVYDRDLETEDLSKIEQQDNIKFDTAIIAALSAKLKVAWSNDVFELWILLHFEEIPTGNVLHRNYIYYRLTEIFKDLPDKSQALEQLTQHPKFYYKDSLKKRNSFVPHVLPLLSTRREQAVRRAQKLEADFDISTPYHRQNPCTKIHHLVMDLVKS